MQLSYELLTRISFQHTYYHNKNFTFLKATPTKETEQILLKYGLVCKRYADGFTLLYDTNFCGRNRSRQEVLSYSIVCRFLIDNTNPNWLSFTTSCNDQNMSDAVFFFKNGNETEQTGRLHLGEYADSDKDRISASDAMSGNGLKKPFAILGLHMQYIKLKEYFIRFEARSVYWRYVVAAQHLLELDELSIVSKKDNLIFEGPIPHQLPDGRQSLLFTSKDLFPFSELPNRELQLIEKYNPVTGRGKVIINKLPNPDYTHFSVIDTALNRVDRLKYANIIL